MSLKNITSFEQFRMMNEEWDYGNSFENSTGFSKSLVGRGLFSLFRFFKVSVDRFRLEFLKRELENEYFAGIIRLMDIDKEVEDAALGVSCSGASGTTTPTGTTAPAGALPAGGTTPPPTTPGALPPGTTPGALPSGTTPGELPEHPAPGQLSGHPEQKQLGEPKGALYGKQLNGQQNQQGQKLLGGKTENQSPPTAESVIRDLDDDNVVVDVRNASEARKRVNDLLQKRKELGLSKQQVDFLVGVGNALDRRASKSQGKPTRESYDFTELLTEELNKTKKLTVKEILGDSATNINTNKLKYVINDLNWRCLAEYMRLNPEKKDEVNKLVNKDALRQIQYAAAKMIYHPVRTPSDKGPTPGQGGGTSKYGYGQQPDLDTVLKNKWDKIIKNTLSLYTVVMNSTYNGGEQELIVDPYRLITLEEVFRSGQYDSRYREMESKRNEFTIDANPTNYYLSTKDADNFGFMRIKYKSNSYYVAFSHNFNRPSTTEYHYYYLTFIDIDELNKQVNSRNVNDIVNTCDIDPNPNTIFPNTGRPTGYNFMIATNTKLTNATKSMSKKYPMLWSTTLGFIPITTGSTYGTGFSRPTTTTNIVDSLSIQVEKIWNIENVTKWGMNTTDHEPNSTPLKDIRDGIKTDILKP